MSDEKPKDAVADDLMALVRQICRGEDDVSRRILRLIRDTEKLEFASVAFYGSRGAQGERLSRGVYAKLYRNRVSKHLSPGTTESRAEMIEVMDSCEIPDD